MEQLIDFIQQWGYIAVFFGSLVEGESVILTASFFAYQGYLSLGKIMIIAFSGTLIADQVLYQIGRHYGPKLLDRFHKMKPAADRAFALLHKWDMWFIISSRFIYGIRVMSAVVIGASGVRPVRYIPLNILSAIIWTVVSCGGGYLLGNTVEKIIQNFHIIEKYFAVGVVVVVGIITSAVYFYKRKNERKALKILVPSAEEQDL